MTTLGIINPKKRREIEGVGGQSLVDLKSTLFKAEDEAKRAKASGVPVSGGKVGSTTCPSASPRSLPSHAAFPQPASPSVALHRKLRGSKCGAEAAIREGTLPAACRGRAQLDTPRAITVLGVQLVMKAPVRNKGVEEREARDLAQADKRLVTPPRCSQRPTCCRRGAEIALKPAGRREMGARG